MFYSIHKKDDEEKLDEKHYFCCWVLVLTASKESGLILCSPRTHFFLFSKLVDVWLKDGQSRKIKNKKYKNLKIFPSDFI